MTGTDAETERVRPEDARDGQAAPTDGREPDGSSDPGAAVRVADLHRGFGEVTVVDGVSFEVDPGTLVSLVGPNGSGKSTLLRVVAGVLAAESGRVDVAARGVRPVGYLPQQPSFRPGFSVADTLRFYADLLGPEAAAEVDVDAVLDQVGLAGVRGRDVEALSGGMTRLLGLAQALLGDPSVLVLDEPASGLDPAISAHIFETVRALADGGRAVLLASHDLVSVERTADRVLVLDRGTFVADGSPDELVRAADADGLVDVFLDAVSGEGGDSEGQGPTVRTGLETGRDGGERQ
ncbi:ABC transporter ATP-binding protein [Salinigranum sp.]|uniref:ABC transporter ATP-binding protein n=1 Tax=Salinigranum sp. TaxID=1966351 RepID=UPI00356B11F3